MSVTKIAAENVIAQMEGWFGISVSMQEAAAIAAEATTYVKVIERPLAQLLFDDQPNDLTQSLEGRRGWRGHAR